MESKDATAVQKKQYERYISRYKKDKDLALLKLDRYTTPSLQLFKNNQQAQGVKVFAIGSPLGISDSLTTGIITKMDTEHLVTDTQILPGNSGGPLINTDGVVLGVNTAIVSDKKTPLDSGLLFMRNIFVRNFPESFPVKFKY